MTIQLIELWLPKSQISPIMLRRRHRLGNVFRPVFGSARHSFSQARFDFMSFDFISGKHWAWSPCLSDFSQLSIVGPCLVYTSADCEFSYLVETLTSTRKYHSRFP